jgi:hypothetical protein
MTKPSTLHHPDRRNGERRHPDKGAFNTISELTHGRRSVNTRCDDRRTGPRRQAERRKRSHKLSPDGSHFWADAIHGMQPGSGVVSGKNRRISPRRSSTGKD